MDITKTQEKYLRLIMKWKYLSAMDISNLLKTDRANAVKKLNEFEKNGYLKSRYFSRRKHYIITSKGARLFGKQNKSNLKINLNEFEHHQLMIDYISSLQLNINDYEIDSELKTFNEKLTSDYVSDFVYIKDGVEVLVEIERTRKSIERVDSKIQKMFWDIEAGKRVEWIVPTIEMKTFLEKRLFSSSFDFLNDKNCKVLLFKNHES